MMTLINEQLCFSIRVNSDCAAEVVFTSSQDICRFLFDLKRAIDYRIDDNWVFSIDGQIKSLAENSMLILSPFVSPFGSNEVRNAIIKSLISKENLLHEKLEEIRRKTSALLDEVSNFSIIPIEFETTMSLKDLIKMNKLIVYDSSAVPPDRAAYSVAYMGEWLDLGKTLFKKGVLFILDLTMWMDNNAQNLLIQEALDRGYYVIVLKKCIESKSDDSNYQEKLNKSIVIF